MVELYDAILPKCVNKSNNSFTSFLLPNDHVPQMEDHVSTFLQTPTRANFDQKWH